MSTVDTCGLNGPTAVKLRETYNYLYRKGYADSGSCYVLADLLLEHVSLRPPVLDVGCGHCPFLKVVQERMGFNREDLYGVDISEVVLAENADLFMLTHASAMDLPFADDWFAAVYSADTLEHLPEPDVERALDEMHRVCHGHLAVGVCCREALTLDEHGVQVHLTVRSTDWWRKKVSAYGRIRVAEIPDPIHAFFIVEV